MHLADNQTIKLAKVLSDSLPQARDARMAVAFVKGSGLALVEDALRSCLDKGGRIEFLVGLDFRLTEAGALRNITKLSVTYPSLGLYCYSNPFRDDAPVYHPKLYIINKGHTTTSIIGSSNLTAGGLQRNIELNIVLNLQSDDELLSNLYETYNSFKFQPGRFQPDEEFIDTYDQASRRIRNLEKKALIDTEVRGLLDSLQKHEQKLPRPKVSASELYGWQKLVFDMLPEGKFKTSDIYKFEPTFKSVYQQNFHIKAKVRQVLQQLRDLGLIKYHANNLWEK